MLGCSRAVNEPDGAALLSRLLRVQRQRRAEAFLATLFNVVVGQVFFASFAFGYMRGPGPVAAHEWVIGASTVFLTGLLVSGLLARRRRERRASWCLKLVEREKPCRVVRFDGYLTIGDEIVLDDAVQKAEREDGRLVLRYLDPRFSGPVLRELEGDATDLDRLRNALVTPATSAT